MERLFKIDIKNYSDSDAVYKRPSARGIIFIDGKIALVYSKKEKYFKFPGGGIHPDEDKLTALCREVREEVGLVVIPSTIKEFGSVLRRQRSDRTPATIYEQENYYYFCEVETGHTEQDLDAYEAEAGFELRLVTLDEAIKVNSEYKSDDFFNVVMIDRERRVLELIKTSLK